ncbi:hypothetical protein KK062_24475 [Fulvivirgaceae bacterium PWU5]|uniref:Uncharacterized protein n=1 Tax=Dawidia cretensis TaxID=2782350 RepID=A0AAP2E1U1_9BACT|nr:hypothetical protein [Dawidia cretensis]MBT1711421.1 hypothetical protein [Dawidia cretensis]
MKKPIIRFLIGCMAVIIIMTACNEKKFEKKGWAAKPDANFPPNERGDMLNDLLSNHKLVGLKYSNVISLLGIPDGVDSSSLSYEMEVAYGSDIDPVYRKDLYLFTTRDSIISSYEIKEWKKEQ